MAGNAKRVLILGGTGEGRELARRLADEPAFFPLTSLAGLTSDPEPIEGETRSGGFGEAAGLEAFIAERDIAAVIDATHPFALRISANAVEACKAAGIPCLRLERPRWEAEGGDEWTHVADLHAAAEAIPAGARALVTVGRQEISAFFHRDDTLLVARMIEPPDIGFPPNIEILLSRPPFTLAQEMTLMRAKSISVLVTKNSGGEATYAKIAAARQLSLPVIVVSRPEKPAVETAQSVDAVVELLGKVIG